MQPNVGYHRVHHLHPQASNFTGDNLGDFLLGLPRQTA
jgi:hypothetical protein